ncbi:ABC transporter ATP-binding protein [Denitromonas ohlonensis]|uniref:ABC transporter ATP-binding protein n=2 Tax=Denitromonas TaxID=139331 RepID=A0A557RW38_9RHOO|nr:ABC transporter ATP-binding protein [Denitromonas ohlonensis]TVT48552.1 MAG: ABC transporter ATP-binding protein [Denitromonas halophila]TVO69372.1 ABC transporter ATP-binding protein [Denitromonas ohlonensis]TVO77472.1 ABC transporter ATP-binding protein [Denitromonas ohlonensis]TVT73131.1 MAG: ABC transporter ATP-binding protein [Denitromonas halophila]TVT74186.1 MAG: ABC transporter ATP-binding protein [Denitromonas halophila]
MTVSEHAELLSVEGLSVDIDAGQRVRPVDGLNLSIAPGQTVALLGESGCGKSMTALALMRLLPAGGRIAGGTVRYHGNDVLSLPEARMRQVRGGGMAMIFQEPSTSLNPVMTVYHQIEEVLSRHRGLSGAPARAEATRLLSAVGIPDADRRLDEYPFQFSGGMKQRAMIAMALAGNPDLLIADEPTTALDVTLQSQVLDVLANLQRSRRMGMLLITHDLGVVARMAHSVAVMYAGELIETGARKAFFSAPLHPYSRKLFAALPTPAGRLRPLETLAGMVPRLDQTFVGCRFAPRCPSAMAHCAERRPAWYEVEGRQVRCHLYDPALPAQAAPPPQVHDDALGATTVAAEPLLAVSDLKVHFPVRKGVLKRITGQVKAVDGISLTLTPGKTLALVGESGCGKTTAGKALMQLVRPTAGSVKLSGVEQTGRRGGALQELRRQVQMVFQDPFASLNPRMRIGDILEEGMAALKTAGNAQERSRRVDALLARVGLDSAMRDRYPHAFSGGQRQRIALARALAVSPKVIVCDEPTSALDVSVQAQILNLMRDVQRSEQLAYLFITHNIAVVDYLADEVAVMYLGRIVEQGDREQVLRQPRHPYTRTLLDAVLSATPSEDRAAVSQIEISLPSPLNPPTGCHFHPRCAKADDRCRSDYPEVTRFDDGGYVRCHYPAVD